MPRKLLILTGELEAERLGPTLQGAATPGIDCVAVSSSRQLHQCAEQGLQDVRLVSFCTRVIVPGSVLNALSLEPYNIHPGSPAYPGLYPEAFAIYEGASEFGATAHVMAEQIDSGAIIRTTMFDVPPGWQREDLAQHVYKAALELFFEIALTCLASDAPLPRSTETWSGRRRSRAQYRSMCAQAEDRDEDHKRRRAFAPDYPTAASG